MAAMSNARLWFVFNALSILASSSALAQVAPVGASSGVTPPPPPPESAPAPAPTAAQRATAPSAVVAHTDVGDIAITGSVGNGLTVKVGDAFSLNLRSRIQLRYQLNIPPADAMGVQNPQQTVNVGTLRLWFSGHFVRPEYTYMIQLALAGRDYREGAVSPIYDAYLDFKFHRDFNLRVGQFFVPFDRLRTVREWALQLADRPRPVSELTLDRDVGIVIYSDKFLGNNSPFAWRLGAFGGGGTNLSLGKEPGALLLARLELRPLGTIDDDVEGDLDRRRDPRLAIGVAVVHNLNTNRLRSTTGTTFLGGTTDYTHFTADLVFKWLGFALQGEFLWKSASNDVIASTAPDGMARREFTRSGYGWIVQASYLFDPPVELVGRMSGLYANATTDPAYITEANTRGYEVAAGANYYFNGHRMKLQIDWIARVSSAYDFTRADHVLHAQLDTTF